jgi:hypothetical protein
MELRAEREMSGPTLMLRSLLFAAVGALSVLSASGASAAPEYKYQCGRYTVTLFGTGVDPEDAYNEISFRPPLPNFEFHFKWQGGDFARKQVDEEGEWAIYTGGKAWLNGKRCKDYVPSKKPKGDK